MSYVKIRPRRGTQQQWEYANPILSEGEMAFEVPESGVGTGPVNIKQGDGTTAWNNLPYAFNAGTLNNKVDTLANTVSTYSTAISELESEMSGITTKTDHIVRINIQKAEPDIVGGAGEQIWIDADMVSGSASINPPTAVTIPVGNTQLFTVISSLTQIGPAEWKTSEIGIIGLSEIIQHENQYSVTATGLVPGTTQLICNLKSPDGTTILYTLKVDVTVNSGGGITVNPSEARIIVGKTAVFTLNNSLSNYDNILWTSSASYYADVDTYNNDSATVRGILPGASYISAIAYLNGRAIATSQSEVQIIGMVIDKTTMDLQVDETGLIYVNTSSLTKRTAEQDGDYDYIRWTSDAENVAAIQSSTESSCTVKAVGAGPAYIKATAYKKAIYTNPNDPANDTVIQTVQCKVNATGYIKLDPISVNMDVGGTASVTVINTLGAGYSIVWSSSSPGVVSVNGSDLSAILTANSQGSSLITATAYKDGSPVASATCSAYANGSIKINGDPNPTIGVGDPTTTLTITNTLPSESYNRIDWEISEPSIVEKVGTTDAPPTCVIRGLTVGQSTVTVRAIYQDTEETDIIDEYSIVVNVSN